MRDGPTGDIRLGEGAALYGEQIPSGYSMVEDRLIITGVSTQTKCRQQRPKASMKLREMKLYLYIMKIGRYMIVD